MQPDEPETIVGEWWILGAQWEGPELHTIVHIFDTNERPRWGSTSSNRLLRQEVGYIPFEAEAANLFFQLVSSRYERASLIVTSNKAFGRWGEVFGDDVVAAAMIDRLVHHAEVITLKGDSYRLKDRDLGRTPAATTEE